MKKIFLAMILFPAIAFAQSAPAVPSNSNAVKNDAPAPVFQFKEEVWDFGNVPQGTPVTHVFEYTNNGKVPVLVSQATASCGCTTPVWTKEPVLAGKSGTVAVTFNAAREGSFVKTVTVLSNAGDPKYLTIKGNVLPPKQADSTTPKEN